MCVEQKVHLNLQSVLDELRKKREENPDDEEAHAEPLDKLLTSDSCQLLVEAAHERSTFVEPYPISDKKYGKRCKAVLLKMTEVRRAAKPRLPAPAAARCPSQALAAHR